MLLFSNKALFKLSIIEAELSTLSGGVPRGVFYNSIFIRFRLPKTVQKNFHHQLQSKQTYSLSCTALQTQQSSPTKTTSPFFKNSKTAGCGYISPAYTNLTFAFFSLFITSAFCPALICPSDTNSSSFLPTPLLSPAK